MTTNTHVVVVGGGYAGVLAANRLTRNSRVTVTLINPRPRFVERIRLHQLVAGTSEATVDFGKVLARRVTLLVGTVTRIEAATRSVALGDGRSIGYDHLIYAIGSVAAPPPEHAFPLATLEDATRLKAVLREQPDAPVTVVGAGPTGIETAAELAETGRTVTLTHAGLLGPYLHPAGRRTVAGRLTELGVTVIDSPGRSPGDGITVWTTGFGVPDLAARSGLSTDRAGRLRTDDTLTSIDDPRIVAAGDSAAPADRPVRMSCQAAGQLGVHAADTVLARIAGRAPVPVRVRFVGQCISLGRRAGIFQFARPDDTAVRAHVSGRAAARLKEFVCWGTVQQLRLEALRQGVRR